MIDSQHACDKVAKILLDNHALDLIEENKRLKREANMSVTGTGGVPLYFNNGISYKAPVYFKNGTCHSPHKWYCTWETPEPGCVLETRDILTKGIEIRRGEQIISCLTPEDIRDHGEQAQGLLWVEEPSMELREGEDDCYNGTGSIGIGLDHPSSTNVSTYLYLNYYWTNKVGELRPYEEGSLVSFLQENPSIEIVSLHACMDKRVIVLPEEQDDDDDDDEE
jgi:hypothetical protein